MVRKLESQRNLMFPQSRVRRGKSRSLGVNIRYLAGQQSRVRRYCDRSQRTITNGFEAGTTSPEQSIQRLTPSWRMWLFLAYRPSRYRNLPEHGYDPRSYLPRLEVSYSDCYDVRFFRDQIGIYRAGHFPCGWQVSGPDAFPKESIVVIF